MLRLKDRNKQVPGGANFFDPVTRYTPPRYASFQTIVNGVLAARRGNPAMAAQYGLSTDENAVADEVDAYNAQMCYDHRWMDYIVGEPEKRRPVAARPFQPSQGNLSRPSLAQSARSVAAGAEIIVDWLKSGAEAVPKAQADQRAATCAACPMNEKIGTLTELFTMAASEAIRGALKLRNDWNLCTPSDEQLGVCAACWCPLKLKVHVPLKTFLPKMPEEDKQQLWEKCWIKQEASQT